MKFLAPFLAAIFLFTSAARADAVALDFSGTSPAGASTTAVGVTSPSQIGMYSTCSFYAVITGGTGGTLDTYIQSYFKSKAGGTWMDVAHLPQAAAGAAAAGYAFTLTRWSSTTAAPTVVNTASSTPSIAANTVVNGALGYGLRVVFKTGAGTSAGAAQVILATCTET